MSRPQRTVRQDATVRGVTLHGGIEVEVRLRPAAADAGVVFVRKDLPGEPRIPADAAHVVAAEHRTVLRGQGGATVETVEHLLACATALGVDNFVVELTGPELPGLDGSAAEYVALFDRAGAVDLAAPRRTLTVDAPFDVTWEAADKWFAVGPRTPAAGQPGLRVAYTYATPDHAQAATFAVDADTFRREIAPARTFVHEAHMNAALARGAGKGATPENTVVLLPGGGTRGPTRFPDECARHKLLDLLGDLFLVGGDVLATVRAHRTGHRENAALVERLRVSGTFHAGDAAKRPVLDHVQIRRVLPHRYPMLLVDRVIEIDGFQRAVGLKNVTLNEPYFVGHYPEQPIMPGVLLVEAMAQLGGLLLLRKLELTGRLPVLLSIDRVKFRRAVVPGDQVRLEAETVRLASGRGRVQCRALVSGVLAAEARLNFALTMETRP
jgi:UDP-3-O-[3-hydroxymyristoyl] N-acetylglucosamine deacetylase/3-hydroxyacyl-[acyl-carrier-protein] dehydratase